MPAPLDEEAANPPVRVVLSGGFHTLTFAGRSAGLHIDFLELIRAGLNVPVTAGNTAVVADLTLPGSGTATEDSTAVLDLLAGTGGLTLPAARDPANGTVTPDADFFGTDSFSSTVIDGQGLATVQPGRRARSTSRPTSRSRSRR